MRTSFRPALGWPRLLFATWILAASALPLSLAWLRSQAPAAAALALIGLLGAVTVFASLRALKPAMALVTLALAPMALKWLLRVGFVVQQGGMDCVRCQGSPPLFAWYWAIETAILLPGLLLLGWLVVLLLPQYAYAGTLRGTAVSMETGLPLEGVLVSAANVRRPPPTPAAALC